MVTGTDRGLLDHYLPGLTWPFGSSQIILFYIKIMIFSGKLTSQFNNNFNEELSWVVVLLANFGQATFISVL